MSNPRIGKTTLILGVGFIVAGVLLLSYTLGLLPSFTLGVPLPLALLALTLALRGLRRNWPAFHVGMSLFFSGLAGFSQLLWLWHEDPLVLHRLWPLGMALVGLSLGAASLRLPPRPRLSLGIPAGFLFLLSLVFSLFSLGLIPWDFQAFITAWWPLLIVVLGLALVSLYYWRQAQPAPDTDEEDEDDEDDLNDLGTLEDEDEEL